MRNVRRLSILLGVFLGLSAIGVAHYEGIGFGEALLIVIMRLPSFSLPEKTVGAVWFYATYVIVAFGFLLYVGTIVVPPMLDAWQAPKIGSGAIRRGGKSLYMVINAVDWEKVQSILEATEVCFGPNSFRLVAVSETLQELPRHLKKRGVGFVRGCLRQRETYIRAGLNWAVGAFVCASTYDDPEVADETTLAYVHLLEGYRPELVTVVEVVSDDHVPWFHHINFKADALVLFDPTTMEAVARQAKKTLNGYTPGGFEISSFDNAQRKELEQQLLKLGIDTKRTTEGNKICYIVLPATMDDPKKADIEMHSKMLLNEKEHGIVGAVLYLSVLSSDLYIRRNMAVCADRVMAEALVAAMIEKIGCLKRRPQEDGRGRIRE